jgi:Mn2+/Fe2+ NRAMP family transporter
VILIFTLLMINDARVMGDHVNGRVRNVIARGFTVTLIAMSAMLLLSPLFT